MRIWDRTHLQRTTKQIRKRARRNWKRARWLAQKGAGEGYGGIRIGCDLRCNGEQEMRAKVERLSTP